MNQPQGADIFSIIMAAGKGQRMNCPGHSKVCLDVDGAPAIVRAIDAYESAGIGHHIVVVGELAEEVMVTVGQRYPNCSFAYQPTPLGTGNAAKVGARVLQDSGYPGAVFVTAGDKYIEPWVVRDLRRQFEQGEFDLVLVAGKKEHHQTSGRILFDAAGDPAAIVEVSEIRLSRAVHEMEQLTGGASRPAQAAAGPATGSLAVAVAEPEITAPATLPSEQLLQIITAHFSNPKKADIVFGELWHLLHNEPEIATDRLQEMLKPLRQKATLQLWRAGQPELLPASAVEDVADLVNLSVYMYRAPALYHSLSRLTRDNAQHEEFLTDTLKILASERAEDGRPAFRIGVLTVEDPDAVMGFNTPEELDRIRQVVAGKRAVSLAVQEPPERQRPASHWHRLFLSDGPALHQFMDEVYGTDRELHDQKRHEYLQALELYRSRLGTDDPVMLVRTPGRINLMGRHVDHRGSHTNMIAISQEVLMVVAPRDDDRVRLYNTASGTFREASFSINGELRHLNYADWLTMVRSPQTLAMVSDGHWANYVKAPAFRLQREFPGRQLRGADIVVHGTIPVGSGLSSSSAMVVGAAETLIAVNDLPVRPAALVDLCGEGEWFVGTRGGSGDHAAIKFARRGQVAHVSFFPFEVKAFAPFFDDHDLVICNSGIQAKKSQGARETYNSKVLGYNIGEILFKRFHPQYADRIEHLRDIRAEHLGIELADLYRMLSKLPLQITEAELFDRYGPFAPEEEEKLNNALSGIENREQAFAVRPVVIYGLAECERARQCLHVLQSGDADELGLLWNISHDGDRVVRHDERWRPQPFAGDCSDAYLEGLVRDLETGSSEQQARAQMPLQTGCYACSTPEIDLIVDLALGTEGVKGAQISGAGLGGCVMILVESGRRDQIVTSLRSRGLDTAVHAPVAGSGIVAI